jgi:phosphatidylserine decarboxylase
MVITGLYFALAAAAAGALLGWLTHPWAGAPFYIFALFCLWFFRDPEREIPQGPYAVSPADGTIVRIKASPKETVVSIFMSVFDVHVNRAPIAGKVVEVVYKPGKFLVASRDEAAVQNEMNTITIDGRQSVVKFSQIAGLIARRIVCYKKPGDFVTAGERIGLIRFGSRVDVHLGPEWSVRVKEGERVRAGASILAELRAKE